jgi:serine/threonine-protein kinase
MSELVERLRQLVGDRYRIEGELGHGGMAVVYLAEDLRHQRKVALKVLRPELSAILGAERFLQEIRIVAHLQHPHVLPLFESGNADGLIFYVMPYVEGESVRLKLVRERQLSIDEAVQITTQVATALDYAHRRGVVHRDIKPENILLADGQALVADFGIALAVSSAAGDRLTETGLSVGTPQYMSPEQAAGERNLDGRADIYSLACVLYEMLTGEPPHTGATLQVLVARITTEKPRPIAEVRESVPRHVAAALHKALAKLPADRFAHAAAFAAALARTSESALAVAEVETPLAAGRPARRFQLRGAWAAWIVTGTVAVVAAAAILLPASERGGPEDVFHFTVPVAAQQLASGAFPSFALSPDGNVLVFRGPDDGLLLRHLSAPDAVPIPGTEGAVGASFSPDGEWIAVSQASQIRKIPTRGGPAVPIAATSLGRLGIGWGEHGSIFLGGAYTTSKLMRVSDQGGPIEPLTSSFDTVSAIGTAWPQPLPGGDAVMFTSLGLSATAGDSRIVAQDLRTGERRTVVEHAMHGRYVRSGQSEYVLYALSDGSILAAPFDLRRRRVTGPAFPVLSDVQVGVFNGAALFAVSANGTLAFVRGSSTTVQLLKWVDRTGREVGQLGTPLNGDAPRLSPDGRRVAISVRNPANQDIWLRETATGRSERVTFGIAEEEYAVWSPDGRSLAYAATVSGGSSGIYIKSVGSAIDPKLVFSGTTHLHPSSWSPDGRALVLNELTFGMGFDVRVLSVDGKGTRLVATGPGTQANGVFSPDGRWVAFQSDETGRSEVYAVSFPELGGKRQISTEGGVTPKWAPDGSALFYRNGRRLITVPVSLRPSLSWGPPRTLFETDATEFEVAPDGTRFLLLVPNPEANHSEIHIVLNWFQELKQRERAAAR